MRECKILCRNEPSEDSIRLANLLIDRLMDIDGSIMDNDCKSAIRKIRQGTYTPKYNRPELRIDIVYDDEIGITSSMGTTAIISRRILSAFHYTHAKLISEMIFVAHSEVNAWYQNNREKDKKVNGNGNRATSKALLDLVDDVSKSISIPLTIIEVTDSDALEAYKDHFSIN
jgi:hypothetical protein